MTPDSLPQTLPKKQWHFLLGETSATLKSRIVSLRDQTRIITGWMWVGEAVELGFFMSANCSYSSQLNSVQPKSEKILANFIKTQEYLTFMNLGSATYYSETFHKCPVSRFYLTFWEREPLEEYLKYVEGVHKTTLVQKVAFNQLVLIHDDTWAFHLGHNCFISLKNFWRFREVSRYQ